jgi:beta-glucosidase
VQAENTGDRAGKVVLQVYAERPKSTIERPVRWLVGFVTATLDAGASERLSIDVPARAFAHWDNGWQYEPGTFRLRVGTSVEELPLTTELRFDA